MKYRLREIAEESKFSDEMRLDAIERAVPMAKVIAVLEDAGLHAKRVRKLNFPMIMLLVIAMGMYGRESIETILEKMASGLRYVWPDPDYELAVASALCYRRYQLGAKPVVELFHQVCVPMATPETPGAFLFGLRVMAIDGTTEDVADTPENERAFGRHRGDRGSSAFPQLLGVYLVECGTHAIVDAGFWRCHSSERKGGLRMLRTVNPGMLVMWDCGFHSFKMVYQTLQRGAHVLSRLPAYAKPERIRTLPDGSWLGYIYPTERREYPRGTRIMVRVIEYTITDPALPGYGEHHRLITTLLDHETYPALDLACAYHERWEIEMVIDEVDTHQRLVGRPLRSKKPVGVIQELYGLLIAHYAVRYVMHDAACRAGLDPDRISFTRTLEIIRKSIPEFQQTTPEQLDPLYDRLLRDVAAHPLPKRRLRSTPRVVKRKMSNFPLKRKEHRSLPKPTKANFRESVLLI